MKTLNSGAKIWSVLILSVLAGVASAQVVAPAWQRLVSDAAKKPADIKALMANVEAVDQPSFAAATFKAIGTLPVSPEQRAQAISLAARQLVGGSKSAVKPDVVAQLFAAVPTADLAALAEGLMPAFNRTRNGLSKEMYRTVAKDILTKTAEAVATVEYPAARMSVALAVFKAGDDWDDEFTQTLAKEVLPSGGVSAALVAEAATQVVNGNYQPISDMTGVPQVITQQTQESITTRTTRTPVSSSRPPAVASQGGGNLASPPALNDPIERAVTSADQLLSSLGDRDTTPLGEIIQSGSSKPSDPAIAGGELQQGGAGVPGDFYPAPPPPPPPPIPPIPVPPPVPPPYQGQTFP